MLKLLRTLILRPSGRDLLRTALTILSVALGSCGGRSDRPRGRRRRRQLPLVRCRHSPARPISKSLPTGGIDERYMATLAALPFDVHFAPLMEAQLVLPGIGAVPLYGADLCGAPSRALPCSKLWPHASSRAP